MHIFRPGDRVIVHVPHGFEGFVTVVMPVLDKTKPGASHYIVTTSKRRMTIEAQHVSPAR